MSKLVSAMMVQTGIGGEKEGDDFGPPAFLYRKFRTTGNETWEILPRLIAEWTLATISEREPNVARARLCLSIPEDVDQETKDCMQTAFGLRKENGDKLDQRQG